jgi:hypothetical protein
MAAKIVLAVFALCAVSIITFVLHNSPEAVVFSSVNQFQLGAQCIPSAESEQMWQHAVCWNALPDSVPVLQISSCVSRTPGALC